MADMGTRYRERADPGCWAGAGRAACTARFSGPAACLVQQQHASHSASACRPLSCQQARAALTLPSLPPTLTLLPANADGSGTVLVEWGEAPAVSLLPCASGQSSGCGASAQVGTAPMCCLCISYGPPCLTCIFHVSLFVICRLPVNL
jgi:hypothetical protein